MWEPRTEKYDVCPVGQSNDGDFEYLKNEIEMQYNGYWLATYAWYIKSLNNKCDRH